MNKFEKLIAIQSELKAPKSQYNSFGKYKYRNCEDILEAVKPLLAKHKAALFISDSVEVIGERFYITATVHFVDIESGEELTVSASAREEESKKGMDGPQVTGASSSYARKYALNGLFAIDDTKDSDSTNTGEKPVTKPYAKPESTQQDYKKLFIAECKAKGIDVTEFAKKNGITKSTTNEEFIPFLEIVKAM